MVTCDSVDRATESAISAPRLNSPAVIDPPAKAALTAACQRNNHSDCGAWRMAKVIWDMIVPRPYPRQQAGRQCGYGFMDGRDVA